MPGWSTITCPLGGFEPYQLKLGPDEAYNRVKHYGNTPTSAQRRAAGEGYEFDHDPPLVQHYYEGAGGLPGYNLTPAERYAYAASTASGHSALPSVQRAQGALAHYARAMKMLFGLDR